MSPSVPPLMSSDEVNLLVYAYLAESSLDHSAFTLYSESRLSDFLAATEDNDNPPAVPSNGQLIRILQKGLLYLQAEAKYRGEDVAANPPRLIGYSISDTLPLPNLPKSIPPPSPPATASDKGNNAAQASTSSLVAGPSSRKKHLANITTNGNSSNPPSLNSANGQSSLKRKESSKTADSGNAAGATSEDFAGQTQHKKQRMAAKSPTASTSDALTNAPASAVMASSTKDLSTVEASANIDSTNVSSSDGSHSVRNRKGKGKAVDTQDEADSSIAELTSTTMAKSASSASAGTADKGSSKMPGPIAARSAGVNGTSNWTNKPDTFSQTTTQRRSTSPVATKRPIGNGIISAKEKSRTRSASPSTTLRSGSGSSAAPPASARSTMAAQTPTIDSSKASAAVGVSEFPKSALATGKNAVLPVAARPEPQHVVGKDGTIALKGHTMPVQPCHWNPKVPALLATGSSDSTMRIWDVPETAKDREPIPESTVCKHSSGQRRSDVTAVEWNKDGSLLASGSEDGIARIWTPSGDLHLVLSMHQRLIFCVKWNSTGSMLLTGSLDHSICLWDTGYGKVKQQWTTHSDSILDIDWMTDEIFASCSMDKMINIHQIGRNTPVYRFKGHSDEVNCTRFCPSNRQLASGSDDHTVRIWSLQPVKSILGLSDQDVKKEASDDSSRGAEMDSSESQEKPFLVLRGHDKEVHAVSWCPRPEAPGQPKLLASASFDGTSRIWDAIQGTCLHIFARHSDMVYSLAWQPEKGDYLATGSNDKRMCVLKVPHGNSGISGNANVTAMDEGYELAFEYEHPGPIYEISWHPARHQIAVCGKSEIVSVVDLPI